MSELPPVPPAQIAGQPYGGPITAGGPAPEGITRQHELKFLLNRAQADAIAQWAGERLTPDPLADGAEAYRVSTLYFDTPALDVYRRTPGFGGSFRARRYGDQPEVYLERKRKSNDGVRERRAGITAADLARLAEGTALAGWAGDWFHQGLLERGLQHACRLSYQRQAFIGEALGEPFRLTIDRNGRCAASSTLDLEEDLEGAPLLHERSILEMRYSLAMPGTFKTLIREFGLAPARVSKYRLAVEACGLAPMTIQVLEGGVRDAG